MNTPARGSLLGIEHLDTKEILGLLKLARRMNPQKARPLLRGKRVVLLFYEASTRTRTSFEFAAKALGAITLWSPPNVERTKVNHSSRFNRGVPTKSQLLARSSPSWRWTRSEEFALSSL